MTLPTEPDSSHPDGLVPHEPAYGNPTNGDRHNSSTRSRQSSDGFAVIPQHDLRSHRQTHHQHRRRRSADVQPRTSRRDRNLESDFPSDASLKELVERLVDQKRESHTLRRALKIAVERIQLDSQQAAAAERERATSESLQQMRLLNERRIAAQQEAYKVSQDLRVSEFQLKAAHDKIARVEGMLRTVEHQRDDAERAATEAREKARQLNHQRLFQAAREEGRRLGFEEGLRKGRIDQERLMMNPNRQNDPLPPQPGLHPPRVYVEQADESNNLAIPNHPLRNFDDDYEQAPEEPRAPAVHVQRPNPPLRRPPASQRPVPAPSVPANQVPTPSIQLYEVDIPPTSQLQQQYNLNEQQPPRSSQQWVTAEQHLSMTAPESPRARRKEDVAPLSSSSQVDPTPEEPQALPAEKPTPIKPKKESWYRTLSRRFQRKPKSEPTVDASGDGGVGDDSGGLATSGATVLAAVDEGEEEEAEEEGPPPSLKSWYQPRPIHPPTHIRVPGVAKTYSSIDSQSISQLDIIGTPAANVNKTPASVKPLRPKQSNLGLHVINKDPPMNGAAVRGPATSSLYGKVPKMLDESSVYSRPSIERERRRASAANSVDQRTQQRTPGPRRPAHLTIPAPLARPDHRRVSSSPERTPIGIEVQSPSTHEQTASEPPTLASAGRPLPGTTNHDSYLSPISAVRRLPLLPAAGTSADPAPWPFRDSASSFQSILLTASFPPPPVPSNYEPPSDPGPMPRNHYPKSPRPQLRPLHRSDTESSMARPASADPAVAPDPHYMYPGYHSRTQSQPTNLHTPETQNQPLLPANSGPVPGRYTSQKPQMQPPPPPPAPPPPPHAPAAQHFVSDARTPGPAPPASLPNHRGIVRVPSNLSITSGQSYSRYDPAKYLDPAYFDHSAGGGNVFHQQPPPPIARVASPVQRPRSRAASITSGLSYVTDPNVQI